MVGIERAMVVHASGGTRQGGEILDTVREKTKLPLFVVSTHDDHFFGNAVLADADVTEFWAHENRAAAVEANIDIQRWLVAPKEPEMAEGEGQDVGWWCRTPSPRTNRS